MARAALPLLLSVCLAPAKAYSAPTVKLLTFDGEPATKHDVQNMDDPVMGGASASTFEVSNGACKFSGHCAIVPFLKAPGFCKLSTVRPFYHAAPKFADASSCIDGALLIEVRSSTPQYEGFKVAFGAKNATRPRPGRGVHHAPPSFKAPFRVPAGSEYSIVRVPFSSFSVDWSEYTGACDTKDPTGEQHTCCGPAHPEVCPTAAHLAAITSLELWAEGVEGQFALDVKSIAAGH